VREKTFDLTKALTRFDQQKKDGITPQMPPNPMPHVIDRLTEIGLTGSDGMSAKPLPWSEIYAWQQNTHVRLSAWEAKLIRSLSAAYVAESRRAEDETCPPPWRGEVTQAEIAAEIAILDAILD
jgi:hypothetical protein